MAISRGRSPPAHLLEGPELDDAALPYWQAFWTLSAARMVFPGFGVVVEQPIPVSEMEAFMRGRVGYDSEFERDGFIRLLQTMDSSYREIVQEQRAESTKRPGRPGA